MSRILGLDVGEKRIGVAMSDELGMIAHPLTVITRDGLEKDLIKIKEIVKEYSPVQIVVGMPLNMNGTIGESGRKMLSFTDFLKKELPVSIETWDERLTTVSSEKVLLEADLSRKKRKKVIDKVAAAILLQCYLDCIGN
jgi:putative Holliday junction resolvase